MLGVDLGQGLSVSRMGYGAMALSYVYGTAPEREAAIRTLNGALDTGVSFIDTADVYGEPRPGATGPAGTNEELVAAVLAERRDEVQLATKFAITGDPERPVRGDAAYVQEACEQSLRRLGVETIDLYYMHRRDLERPITETVEAMAALVQQGKVRHLGLSEVTADELREAHRVHPITAVQSEWSLWSRDVEAKVVPACAELGVGFVPYSPLGRGYLTGTLTRADVESSMRKGQARMDAHFDENQAVVDVVRGVADDLGATAAQVALAWLLSQGDRLDLPVVPIPGTRSLERVIENAASVDLRLDDDQLARLDGAAELVQGSRNISADPRWVSSGRE